MKNLSFSDGLFGSMNLFASANGLPVWANLLLAVTEEVESAMQGELNKREARIARYTDKYAQKAKKSRGGKSSSAENDGLQFFSGSLVISSL